MSKIDYQALRDAAEKATQGEWVAFISSGTGTYAVHTLVINDVKTLSNGPALMDRKTQRTTLVISQLSTLK